MDEETLDAAGEIALAEQSPEDLALQGAAGAVETSREAIDIAATSAVMADTAVIEAENASGTAEIAATIAVDAATQAEAATQVATASADVAFATVGAFQELRTELTQWRESVETRLSARQEQEEQQQEETQEEQPEEIPVAKNFRTQSESEVSESGTPARRRKHKFGR